MFEKLSRVREDRTLSFRLSRGSNPFAPPLHDRFRVWRSEDDGFDMLAELGFSARGAKIGKERVDLTERGEDLAVGGEERIPVNGARRYHRRCHVPIAKHHAERCVAFASHRRC